MNPVILIAQSATAGHDSTVDYLAPWPPWVTIVLVALAALFAYGLYYREQSDYPTWVKSVLATIRFALICLVFWMMYGYTLRPFRTDLPDVLLILDNSASMHTVDAPRADSTEDRIVATLEELNLAPASRLNQAKTALLRDNERLLRFLQEHYQLKTTTLDATALDSGDLPAQIRGLEADVGDSKLGLGLRQALQRQRGRSVAAVIYLTDGITTSGPPLSEIATQAKQRNIPLHLVGLGSQLPVRDLRLNDLLVDDVVFVGDLVTFDLTLAGDGYENEQIEVILRRADGSAEPTSQRVELTSASDAQAVRLAMKAEEKGTFEFIIETPPRDGEITADNNTLRATVEVRDEKTSVLLVQSYPSYEYHYLKTLLERESSRNNGADGTSSIELSVLLQDADPEYSEVDAVAIRSFPPRDELFEFDVCIFGDVNPTFLGGDALADLREFVQTRGRGFIGIAGPRFFPMAYANTPLADILPFDLRTAISPSPDLPIETGFRPTITPLGKRMPSMQLSLKPEPNAKIWDSLSELYWFLEVEALKSGVRVLAEHPHRTSTSGRPLPIITLSYVGAGKVLFQNTDDSWRWRIGHGDQFYGRYWHQSVRYLSRFKLGQGRDVELTSDREAYVRSDIVTLRARFFDERLAPDDDSGVLVMLEQTGRGERRVVLERDAIDRGTFSADLANLGAGQYHAWISEPTSGGQATSTDFEISTPHAEMTRLEMDAADLRRAAEISGGEFYTLETIETLIDNLPVGRQVRIEPLPPQPLWNSWKIALLFIGLLVAEWLLRRQAGMV